MNETPYKAPRSSSPPVKKQMHLPMLVTANVLILGLFLYLYFGFISSKQLEEASIANLMQGVIFMVGIFTFLNAFLSFVIAYGVMIFPYFRRKRLSQRLVYGQYVFFLFQGLMIFGLVYIRILQMQTEFKVE